MGKDYSDSNYKKAYDTEYIKSYEDRRLMKKLYEEQAKSYKSITQRIGEKPYNKSEKGKDNSEESYKSVSDSVYNPPKRRRKVEITTPVEEQQAIEIKSEPIEVKSKISLEIETKVSEEEPKTSRYQRTTYQAPTVVPPPFVPTAEEKAKERNKEIKVEKNAKKETGRNYDFYRTMVMPPIMPLDDGTYREMQKKEIVDETEARKILAVADFKPKEPINMFLFVIISLAVGIPFTLFGPLAILFFAFLAKFKSKTEFEKKMSFSKLSVSISANDDEKALSARRAQIYMIIGVAVGAIQIFRAF